MRDICFGDETRKPQSSSDFVGNIRMRCGIHTVNVSDISEFAPDANPSRCESTEISCS
ncbi:hypothetical protein BD410DRAFT_794502 [Rickenella mellea]|uniref:Uncharacterized protein n=1 Tax=Rickenella mellea TaxID=50990 RepID=A0A4Y7PRR4_9AGAM|nr:hypothetical protein BD410DRAFT_794502 [Rickenella mellea]